LGRGDRRGWRDWWWLPRIAGREGRGREKRGRIRGGIAEQARQYNTTRADTAPYRVIGNQAINALGSIYGYKPAATPQSFEEWTAAANPIPGTSSAATAASKRRRRRRWRVAHAGHSTRSTYSGGGNAQTRSLDPAGLFGGGPKKPKGRPRAVQQAVSTNISQASITTRRR
jgi:hypothetical protein